MRTHSLFLSLALVLVLPLAGCAGSEFGGFGPKIKQPIVVTNCPDLRIYSMERQTRISEQLDLIEIQAPDVVEAMGDYLALRDAVRVCKSKGASATSQ